MSDQIRGTIMTLKQINLHNFYETLEAYHHAKSQPKETFNPGEFIRLSVLIHAAKGHVPKRLWSLIK